MRTINTVNNELKDYYQILGVSKEATMDEIRKAYRNKAKIYHPDVNPAQDAHQQFIEISEAYEVLRDPVSRANYDQMWRNASSQTQYTGSAEYQDFQRRAQQQAQQYADMSLDDLIEQVLGFAYEAGRTILVGERGKPRLNLFDYMKMGFFGVILTICLILSFTGIGTIPGIAIGLLVFNSLIKDNHFIGIIPFVVTTIVADILVVILIITWLASL